MSDGIRRGDYVGRFQDYNRPARSSIIGFRPARLAVPRLHFCFGNLTRYV
jgi:hypothetical protein